MGMQKSEKHFTAYKSMPNQKRFFLHSEQGYTEEELNFREWIIKTRANSGIHPDYLSNQSSWFAEDNSQALSNIYEHSWFYTSTYRTRHVIARDDFHIQPIDSQRLQWPELYQLMQQVGDYLLLRNEDLSTEHLNQPMNFVLLDINLMLKGLSQNINIVQVKEQLDLIMRYIRAIEKNISPLVGSDRLFLANFRDVISEEIQPKLTHMIESQLLRERLTSLSKVIKQISTERNRILHFALNQHSVNPHPYDFASAITEGTEAYPTQAVKACAQKKSTELTTELTDGVFISGEQLKDCEHFQLITSDATVTDHYAKAISDLAELERFQTIISQITHLLGQAGEVYTVHQFKKQMLDLLQQINTFIDDSSVPVAAIIRANTQAYHRAIQDQQDMSLWKKWLTSDQENLKKFIKNQDTLSQFPSGISDLEKSNKAAKINSDDIIRHLNQQKTTETSMEAIASQVQELDKLMGSMHHWVKTQHQIKGLVAPPAPISLTLIKSSVDSALPKPVITAIHSTCTPTFFSSTASCLTEREHPPIEPITTNTQNNQLAIGLIILIPATLLGLYLFFNWLKKNDNTHETLSPAKGENRKEFEQLLIKFEDLIARLKGFEQETGDDLSIEYEIYIDQYQELKKHAKSGIYDFTALKTTYDDFKYFYDEYVKRSELGEEHTMAL